MFTPFCIPHSQLSEKEMIPHLLFDNSGHLIKSQHFNRCNIFSDTNTFNQQNTAYFNARALSLLRHSMQSEVPRLRGPQGVSGEHTPACKQCQILFQLHFHNIQGLWNLMCWKPSFFSLCYSLTPSELIFPSESWRHKTYKLQYDKYLTVWSIFKALCYFKCKHRFRFIISQSIWVINVPTFSHPLI